MTVFRLLSALVGLLFGSLAAPLFAQTPAALQQAKMLVAGGACAEAVALLETAAADGLTPAGAHLLGRCYQALLQHDRAAAAFARADTADAGVLMDWGRSLEAVGRPRAAEARYRAAFRRDSSNVAVAASLARLLADADRYDEVAALYQHLLALDPENGYLHAQLGSAFVRLAAPDSAIVHYERAHALDPGNVRVVLALTKVYYDQQFYLSARRVVDRALAVEPHLPELWRRKGEIALREEDYRLAERAFEVVLQHGDTTALDLRNLGASRYLHGDYEAAAQALEAAYARDDQDVMTAFYLGLAHQELGAYDEALRYLDRAATLAERTFLADIYARIGNTYDRMDRPADAIREYRLARSLDPARPDLLFHLAALYDAYYADQQAVQEAYERFLAAVEEGALPQMERYARQRLLEIREGRFFQDGLPAASPPDSSGGKDD